MKNSEVALSGPPDTLYATAPMAVMSAVIRVIAVIKDDRNDKNRQVLVYGSAWKKSEPLRLFRYENVRDASAGAPAKTKNRAGIA